MKKTYSYENVRNGKLFVLIVQIFSEKLNFFVSKWCFFIDIGATLESGLIYQWASRVLRQYTCTYWYNEFLDRFMLNTMSMIIFNLVLQIISTHIFTLKRYFGTSQLLSFIRGIFFIRLGSIWHWIWTLFRSMQEHESDRVFKINMASLELIKICIIDIYMNKSCIVKKFQKFINIAV